MADNLGLTPGVGATIASKEIASVHWQRMITTFADEGGQQRDTAAATPLPIIDKNSEALILLLEQILSRAAFPDGNGRMRVALEAVSATNMSTNVAQFGGTNVSTGTGSGGAGIPRVTVSSDSSLAANQSVNQNQLKGVDPIASIQAWNNAPVGMIYDRIAVS